MIILQHLQELKIVLDKEKGGMSMDGKMKAAILYSLKNIKVDWCKIPTFKDNEVLIKVKYAGICGSDVPRAMITGARKYPLILGHEFSGEVVETGAKVTKVKPNDRVVVAPLIPCKKCHYCKIGLFGICEHYNIIGTGSNGAFAEYVVVPEDNVLKINDSLDCISAAGVEPATIGYHALQKVNIKPGETVVIVGCGAIGQLTLQWAKTFGASTIIAVDISDEKLDLARKLGADITINSIKIDVVKRIREITSAGADVVVETAGSAIAQQQAILLTRKKGRVVFIGISHNGLHLAEKTVEHILRGEISIQGSWNSYTAPYPGIAWKATIDFMTRGLIKFKDIVSHIITIEDVGYYLKGMSEQTIPYNKVLISFDE